MRNSLPVLLAITALFSPLSAQSRVGPDTPNPIAAGSSLWAEELTFMEIRDLVKSGTTTILIGTGGVEQNGPYVAGGKHNFVLATSMPAIARKIGKTLIAPIVKFVPEGRIEPTPSGHMTFAGTISLEAATFEALLTDICRSYMAHGFLDIILIGDSGGNATGMENVANALNTKWAATNNIKARVHYLPEYYNEDRWSYDFLKKKGIVQIDSMATGNQAKDRASDVRNGIHDDIYYEAQIAVQDPKLIRADQRRQAGKLSLHGVDLSNMQKTIALGKELAEYRAEITARAFEKSKAKLRAALPTAPARTASATSAGAAQDTVTHEIREIGNGTSYVFEPDTLTVKQGDVIRFVLVSGGPHNVAFDMSSLTAEARAALNAGMPDQVAELSGKFLMRQGESYTVSFKNVPAGKYAFWCVPHLAMNQRGVITVVSR